MCVRVCRDQPHRRKVEEIKEKYPVLIGHSAGVCKKLYDITEVADFICEYGVYGEVSVETPKSTDYWYNFLNAETERKYDTKIDYALKNSLYFTGITPKYGQQILTLSTCCGSTKDDRIVVLAVKG